MSEPTFAWDDWKLVPRLCGIYRILHIPTGREYVGSSRDMHHRAWVHRRELLKELHHSPFLLRTFKKRGPEGFLFEVLELVDEAELLTAEQRHIDRRKPEFNVAPLAASCAGVRHTPETKKKRGAATLRVWASRTTEERRQWGEEASRNMSLWWSNASQEQKEAVSNRSRTAYATWWESLTVEEQQQQLYRMREHCSRGAQARIASMSRDEFQKNVQGLLSAQRRWRSERKEEVAAVRKRMTETKRAKYGKLNPDRVRNIRSRYAAGGVSLQSLADEFELSIAMVHGIVRRTKWGDIE